MKLKLNLKDKALKFLINDPVASKSVTFNALKEILKKKFTVIKPFSEIQKIFSCINHKQGQSVQNLADSIDKAANEFLQINEHADANQLELGDKIKLNKFLEVLLPDIKIDVKKIILSPLHRLLK